MRKKILLGLLLVVSVLVVVLNRVMVMDKKTVATSAQTGIAQSTEYVTVTFTPTVTVGK